LALSDLRGDSHRRVQPARVAIVSLLAYLDAAADFPDDEIPGTDVDADLDVACRGAGGCHRRVPGRSVDSGWRAGCPGRPSQCRQEQLAQYLAAKRACHRYAHRGTTRDVVTESAVIDGVR